MITVLSNVDLFIIYLYLLTIFPATLGKAVVLKRDNPSTIVLCSFENSNLCGFTSDKTDFQWTLHHGRTPTDNTGPDHDHTTGTSSGSYLYIESSGRKNREVARLRSQVLQTMYSDDTMCLEFYYNMHGHTVGELSVVIHDLVSGNEDVKFQLSQRNNQSDWIGARFSFIAPTNPYQIIFQGETSYGEYGDIAIDDIKLSESMQYCYFWPPEASPKGSPPTPAPPAQGPEYPHTCGQPNIPTNRVIGGKDTHFGKWPWMAMVILDNFEWCGGTLLGVHWVITAAHCVVNIPHKAAITVRLGAHKTFKGPLTSDINVDKIYIHDKFRTKYNYNYDIALIKLATPAMVTKTVSSICLMNPSGDPVDGEKCYVAGWGKLSNSVEDHYPKRLQDGVVHIRSRSTCSKMYGPLFTDAMICAGKDSGQPDTCYGDSGGPLMCKNNGTWTIAGITSWGHSGGCGQKSIFGVYTRISKVQDWIKSVAKYPDLFKSLHF